MEGPHTSAENRDANAIGSIAWQRSRAQKQNNATQSAAMIIVCILCKKEKYRIVCEFEEAVRLCRAITGERTPELALTHADGLYVPTGWAARARPEKDQYHQNLGSRAAR